MLLDALLMLSADVKGYLTKQQQMFTCHITQSLTFNFGHSCRCQAMTQGLMLEPHTLFSSLFSFIKSAHLPLTLSGNIHKAWLLLITYFFPRKKEPEDTCPWQGIWEAMKSHSNAFQIPNLCFTPVLKACLQNWNHWNGVTIPYQTCECEAALHYKETVKVQNLMWLVPFPRFVLSILGDSTGLERSQ